MFAIQIARSKSGALAYLREHMSNADYLTEQGEQMLVWQGTGATRLGLPGLDGGEPKVSQFTETHRLGLRSNTPNFFTELPEVPFGQGSDPLS